MSRFHLCYEEKEKGTGYFSGAFNERPRLLSVDSNHNAAAKIDGTTPLYKGSGLRAFEGNMVGTEGTDGQIGARKGIRGAIREIAERNAQT